MVCVTLSSKNDVSYCYFWFYTSIVCLYFKLADVFYTKHIKSFPHIVPREETESEYLISMELIQKYVFYVVGFINAAIQKVHDIFTLNDIKAAFKVRTLVCLLAKLRQK